jgi:4-aminobutyrate aminotransferase-like enzyme
MLGNPLGCAMARAAIEEHLKPEVMRQARMVGNRFREALQSLKSPYIRQVRGLGSMLGIELVQENGEPFGALSVAIMMQGLQDGLILLGGGPDGNVLSFSPSFYLSDPEIAFVREKLQEYLISLPGSVS